MPSAKLVGKERHTLVLSTPCVSTPVQLPFEQREREGQRGLKRAFCT